MTSSPEKIEDASRTKLSASHQKTDQTTITVEVKSGEYFAGFTSTKMTEAELEFDGDTQEETERTTSKVGIEYVVEDGLTIYHARINLWNPPQFNNHERIRLVELREKLTSKPLRKSNGGGEIDRTRTLQTQQ